MAADFSFSPAVGNAIPQSATLPAAELAGASAASQIGVGHDLTDEQREQAIRDEGDKAMAAWQRAVEARRDARRHFAQMRELIAARSAAQVARMEQEMGLQ